MTRSILLASALVLLAAGVALAAEAAPTAVDLAKGKMVYDKNCGICHNVGVAGALKLGDKTAWKPHVAMGSKHLLENVVKGKGKMPPKGGHPELSDADLLAAVQYMVEQSK